jgi:hypothetical protein
MVQPENQHSRGLHATSRQESRGSFDNYFSLFSFHLAAQARVEMMRLLKVSQNTVYRLRRELLKEYHSKDQERNEQYSEPENS